MTLRRILEAPIAELTFADIETLIREEAEEGPRLELKRGLPANLYTVSKADGSPSALVERTLGQVENEADPVIARVVEQARSGKAVSLNVNRRPKGGLAHS